jgi:hypothetical protein
MAKKTRRQRERKERRYTSARKRAESHRTFDRTKINVGRDVSLFAPNKEGMKRVDILAYEVGKGNPEADEGDLHYERTFYVHRRIGSDNNDYVCPNKTAGKKCPICEYRNKLRMDPDADEELIGWL